MSKSDLYKKWFKTKEYLDSIAEKAKRRTVKRGQVYWCHFGVGVGRELSKLDPRPCVILQNNIANLHSPNTIVAPITHNTKTLPSIVPITNQIDKNGNCVLDGQINVSNMVCVSKARLGDPILKDGEILELDMKQVDVALAKAVGLMKHYKKIQNKLSKRDGYITKLKEDRNMAQDALEAIMLELNVSSSSEILDKIKMLKRSRDGKK